MLNCIHNKKFQKVEIFFKISSLVPTESGNIDKLNFRVILAGRLKLI